MLPNVIQYVRACEYMGIDPWTNPNYTEAERLYLKEKYDRIVALSLPAK